MNIKKHSGFTLLEILIYTVIFSTMIGFLVISVFQLLDTQKSNRGRISVEAETDFAIGKIDWAMTGAQIINIPVSNATGTVLSINKVNFSSNPIVFDVASGTLRITRSSGQPTPLTSSDIFIDKIEFSHLPQSGNRPEGISITMVAVASSTEYLTKASTTIYNTFYLNK